MNNGRALPWRFGKDIDRDIRLFRVIARIRSLGGKTAQICQPLRAAQSLDVLIKNLLSGRPFSIWKNVNLVRIFHRGGVLDHQTWYLFWRPVAVMAGVASY